MIVTVTPNPALDLTWHVDSLVFGGTHRADAGAARAGGKGLNVARVAHSQGAEVIAVATVGGATGGEFALELNAGGVPNVLVPVAAATRRSIAVVDETRGDTTIINERGTDHTNDEWEALHRAVVTALPGATVLVISGSMPPHAHPEHLTRLIDAGREAGAAVIVDTSGPALVRAAGAGAAILKPNAAELAEATGLSDPVEGARALIARGAELILLSLGAEGMLAVTASAVVHARLDESLAGNPTGAGDAAVAACAVRIAAGEHEPEALLRAATAWSAAAVLMPLAGEISEQWPALQERLTVSSFEPSRKDPR